LTLVSAEATPDNWPRVRLELADPPPDDPARSADPDPDSDGPDPDGPATSAAPDPDDPDPDDPDSDDPDDPDPDDPDPDPDDPDPDDPDDPDPDDPDSDDPDPDDPDPDDPDPDDPDSDDPDDPDPPVSAGPPERPAMAAALRAWEARCLSAARRSAIGRSADTVKPSPEASPTSGAPGSLPPDSASEAGEPLPAVCADRRARSAGAAPLPEPSAPPLALGLSTSMPVARRI
jgi:hypothetical protein